MSGRLSRAQTQERNRARVLAAARDEFAERGFRAAKVDAIAERAELTRGAVYSNFPGKRALYLAVLADLAERAPEPPQPRLGGTVREALGAFARAWVARLALADEQDEQDEQPDAARLRRDLVPEIVADERVRLPFAQLLKLDALLLALSLERLRPGEAPSAPPLGARVRPRMVRTAETVLTTLHGASQMAVAAPGFVEPFDIVSACERLAGMDLNDWWAPPHLVPPVLSIDEPWSPPEVADMVRGGRARPADDGVVVVLGLHRLAAAEEAVRAAPEGTDVTVALVTGEPAELAPLVRLTVADVAGCLRQAVPASALPRLRVVCDESGSLASAAGVPAVSDATEVAVRVHSGRIVARAEGPGAGHAVASRDQARASSGRGR
ncbi:transcriptional regulator, TetR family [Streptoalloteichus tenebrarius]|uniref:Transcriptional regulator, TetR family n=1 Tax=Streptoalloteichus tenebrarius (strain ATCC 17920 / DSM 40477 / JCM 4838 / CBS 697.72 / NBRC 16177 / NCIMB 11028 / NRRL B-12390 / A12253. 1 / ISP 5477) TaxID=1933 RepID=A0ABT1HWH9_STRSD|nr:TetR/AcrR family transcriptional regulator [Streptoalloteichus tenebrarius]MCP2259851.1 transcriptional regulator, TetR family [Streptoalloteichus tenebrarius]BFE99199.1 TetR/AcrR family transcriptional regulator [Streptoalloteichus tenebrarius]